MDLDKVLIRECTHRDLENIFQLDKLWEKENIAHIFTYEDQEDFRVNFERFREYFLVVEVDDQRKSEYPPKTRELSRN